jgi:hypothetical protein
MRRLLPILTATLALSLGPTAALAKPPACAEGLHRAMTAELYFGRSIGEHAQVSDADWTDFVDQQITPRFPDGLSVNDVYGQWRTPKGQFVREASKALFLVLDGTPDERQRLDLVRSAYKLRFHQQSVMLVEQQACVAF